MIEEQRRLASDLHQSVELAESHNKVYNPAWPVSVFVSFLHFLLCWCDPQISTLGFSVAALQDTRSAQAKFRASDEANQKLISDLERLEVKLAKKDEEILSVNADLVWLCF